MALISKSSYLIGLQCPKYLWIKFNKKELLPELTQSQEYRFSQGNLVGEYAKKLFPEGINISTKDFSENLKKSKELIQARKTLFEPAFIVDNLYSRADILKPVNEDEWDIIEVKSATHVKEVYYHDLSFQKFCYEKFGLKIRKSYVMIINKKYEKNGEINPKELFKLEDITEQVEIYGQDISKRVEEMFKIIKKDKIPLKDIHIKCNEPYPCPIIENCWQSLPEQNIFHFSRINKLKAFELYDNGISKMEDTPEDFNLSANQRLQLRCAKNKEIYVNKEKLKGFIDKLEYPLYFLDFEAFNSAIPYFDKTTPYQQIPFQYSLHIDDGKQLKHHSYIASGKEDFRKELLNKLKKDLGNKGSILVYWQTFEKKIIKSLAELYNEQDWAKEINSRIVDLIEPFNKFYYYNPQQKGSASIKKVLPALTGVGYSELNIGDGITASLEFLRVNFTDNNKDKQKVFKDLEKYCGLDTEGMVWILEELKKIIQKNI